MRREYLHPLTIRIWHWVHGIAIIMLVLTGIQLRVPNFFTWFGTFKSAVKIHNIFGFVVLFDYLIWLGFYLVTRQLIRQYVPTIKDYTIGVPSQAAYYFARFFLGDRPRFEPTREEKFNSLQKTTYFGIMFVLVPLQILTGVLLWDLERFHPIVEVLGGVRIVDAFHIIMAYVFASFLIVHLYLSSLGHTFFSHFKAMILGYEEREIAEAEPE
jgi:thiosulfate reductase cytochrome b subunit